MPGIMAEHQAAFRNVPPEVLVKVSSFLPAADRKRLRLVSRQMSALVARQCFARHTTVLASFALERTEELIKHDRLGGLVKHLRIVAESAPGQSAEHTNECLWNSATGKSEAREAQFALDPVVSLGEEYLVQRLSTILSWGGRRCLRTLELHARFIKDSQAPSSPIACRSAQIDHQRLWARASQLYRLTMTALARSGVAIPDLRIYSNTAGFCVPSYDITIALPRHIDADMAQYGAAVENCALKFATRVDHGWERLNMVYGADAAATERRRQRRHWLQIDDEVEWRWMAGVAFDDDGDANRFDVDGSDCDSDDDVDESIEDNKGSEIPGRYGDTMPQAICEDNYSGVARFLKHMPNLRSLELHMFQTLEYEEIDGLSRLNMYGRVFRNMVRQTLQFNKLRRLTLRGICLTGSILITFMERHRQIESLELHHAILCNKDPYDRHWKTVLRTIARKCAREKPGGLLARMFCSDLCDVPRSGRATANYGSRNAENLRGPDELLRQEWIDWGWCTFTQGAPKNSPTILHSFAILHTREFNRQDMETDDIFEIETEPGRDPPSNTAFICFDDDDEYLSLRQAMYGTTYG